ALNLALALLFIGPVDRMAVWLFRMLPDPTPSADPGAPRYLERAALETASVALVNAAREALRMADMVEAMLKGALEVFRNENRRRAREISQMDHTLDLLGVAVHRYLAEISGEELNEEDSLRSQEIFTFTINFDYIGDIVAVMMAEFATRKIKRGQPFAPEELEEVAGMHAMVLESLNLGLAVFMRGDEQTARQLMERKKLVWQAEKRAAERYFQRLRETDAQNGKADDSYLRVLRDLKRIHSFIAALAYPILDRAGQLQERLVEMTTPELRESEVSAPAATEEKSNPLTVNPN
ncbi:MAG: Na/Pi cotransporter family protein, partial [Deltaproteobacteria bacterium]|nr:Na/Pi cotransporter family protein [Deltaproteobacteria bacterium]